MIRKLLISLILLSAGSLVITLPQPFQFVSGVLQAYFLPGFLFTFFVLGGRISRSDRFFLSILLSPVLLSILLVAANYLTGDIFLSSKIILIACYLLFIAAIVLRKDVTVKECGGVVPRRIYILCFVYSGLIFLSFAVNRYMLIRSDAWYHAAVVREVFDRGIPPNEPLLADISIKYMWFYHLFQAVCIKLSGMTIFRAMGFFNIISAFLFPYWIARFVMNFTDRKGVAVFATLLTLAGLDAVPWILWPLSLLRVFTGDVTGWAELERIISSITINGADVIYFLAPFGTWPINFSDKFLTITIFGYSFSLFLASATILLKENFIENSRIRSSILLFILVLGVFLFHVVTGITLVSVIVGSCILMYITSRYIYGGDRRIRVLSTILITVLLAALSAMLYFLPLVSADRLSENDLLTTLFHIGYTNIFCILFPLVILFPHARDAFKKLLSGTDYKSRILVCWIACLIFLSFFINIGTMGENKLVYLLFLIIGPPIYVQIADKIEMFSGLKRILPIAAVIVLFLVPPVLTFRGFMMETPKDEMWSRRYYITDEDRRIFDWVEKNTPEDAVIVENNINHLFPVYAGRRNFYSWYNVAEAFYGGEKMELYRHIQTSLYGKDELAPDIKDKMKGFKQKLYVAVWREDIESNPWLIERFNRKSEWFKEEYASDRVSLYSLK